MRSNSPNGSGESAAAVASAAPFLFLPSIPLMDMCNVRAPLAGATLEDQHLLLGSVTAPLHGDGMVTLVPSFADCVGYGAAAPQTHTSAGVPLASLVAEGSAAVGGGEAGGEAADQSFAEFATSVWPKLVE